MGQSQSGAESLSDGTVLVESAASIHAWRQVDETFWGQMVDAAVVLQLWLGDVEELGMGVR